MLCLLQVRAEEQELQIAVRRHRPVFSIFFILSGFTFLIQCSVGEWLEGMVEGNYEGIWWKLSLEGSLFPS